MVPVILQKALVGEEALSLGDVDGFQGGRGVADGRLYDDARLDARTYQKPEIRHFRRLDRVRKQYLQQSF